VLTNHIAIVESHVVMPLPGTATKEPFIAIAIVIRLPREGRRYHFSRTDILQVSCT
jgi:hypothetical protein